MSSYSTEQAPGFRSEEADRLTLSRCSVVGKAAMPTARHQTGRNGSCPTSLVFKVQRKLQYQELRRKHTHPKNEAARSSCTDCVQARGTVACWQDTHMLWRNVHRPEPVLGDIAVLQPRGSKGQTVVGEGKDPPKPTSTALLKR